jgi:choline dehydrogenase
VGWSYKDALPYYKKMETDDYGDPSLHGHSGPVRVRRFDYSEVTPVLSAFVETAKALGFPEIDDLNGPEKFGAGRLPMNIENGTRLSTALTYPTDEVWRRDNLTIRGESLVDTVRFKHRRATGVRLVGGKRSTPTRSSLPREQLGRERFSCGQESDLRLILTGLAFPSSLIYPWVGAIWISLQVSFRTRPRRGSSARPSQRYR